MASTEEKPKSERKKMIAAIALGVVALFTLWFAFFSSTPKATAPQVTNKNGGGGAVLPPRPPSTGAPDTTAPLQRTSPTGDGAPPLPPSPITVDENPPPAVPDAGRNIFAFYIPPTPTPTPVPAPPTPTPTPPPPVTLSSVSPTNVYARTGDFKLDVSGDKFTPQTHVYVDGRELQTQYISQRQLSATVPAAVIAYEGPRQVVVRNSDGTLYSNQLSFNVAAPPVPNYTYVGLVGGPSYNDTAILKDKNSKNLVNVQRGDTLAGRFRVTSISQREVQVLDTTLRIKHTLPLTNEGGSSGGPQRMPSQPVINDDEP